MPTDGEKDAIQAIQTIFGTASFFASVVMAHKLYHEVTTNMFTRMLRSLCFIDIVLSLFFLIGRAGNVNMGLCRTQALIIQWFSTASMLWVILLSYQMYHWVVLKKHPKRMEKIIKRSIVSIFLFSGLLAIVLLGINAYDHAFLWCWISPEKPAYRIAFFEVILLASWLISLVVLQLVTKSVAERVQSSRLHANITTLLGQNSYSVEKKLSLYIGSFIVIWFFALLNRIVEYALGHVCFPTAVLQAIFLSSQGLINTLLYGNFFDWKKIFKVDEWLGVMGMGLPHHSSLKENVIEHRPASRGRGDAGEAADGVVVKSNSPGSPGSSSTTIVPHRPKVSHIPYTPKQYSIFITTLNMGEASLDSVYADVKDWIVQGHDIYAIGLQECIELNGLRDLILNHLGGPTRYAMYTTSIGSGNTSLGYHGYIALTVFVKISEIDSGYVYAIKPAMDAAATGTDLIIATAQNKGAVGIALHIHDTSIGFVTCHLPSDSKGKSKLTKRNASAHAILKEVILAPEDLGFDLHLQHDHVFVFGDLNYRMETSGVGAGVNSLTGVAVACTIEKNTLQDDANWLARKYNLLRHSSDLLYPSIEEVRLIRKALFGSRGAWSSVLRADELRSIMDDGDAFSGFEEPMPCFPPSYKRRKGKNEGDCGDYTDFSMVVRGYSNTGEVENMLRTPPPAPPRPATLSLSASIEKVQSFMRPGSMRMNSSPLGGDAEGSVRERGGSRGSGGSGGGEGELSGSNNSRNSGGGRGSGSGKGGAVVESGDVDEGEEGESETDLEGGSRKSESGGAGSRVKKRKAIATTPLPNAVETPSSKKELDPSKLRPPSYTDRILMHSLPDRGDRVTVQAYDFCDTLRVSDHRAVSMTVLLEVNQGVCFGAPPALIAQPVSVSSPGQSPSQPSPPSPTSRSSPPLPITPVTPHEPRFELYEVLVSDMCVTLYDLGTIGEEEEEDAQEEPVFRDSDVGGMVGGLGGARSSGVWGRGSITGGSGKHHIYDAKPGATFGENPMRMSETTPPSPSKKKKGGVRFGGDQEEKGDSIEMTSPVTTPSSSSDIPANEIMLPPMLSRGDVEEGSPPPPRGSMKKSSSRRKSLFAFFLSTSVDENEEENSKSETVSPAPTPEENELALIKELSRENLDWKNKLHKPNEWRKRKLEEARKRKEEKNSLGGAAGSVKRKKKSDDKNIYSVTMVFPLPAKDPLLAHRKVYDYAQVFEGGEKFFTESPVMITPGYEDGPETENIKKAELLRPFTIFPWASSSTPLTSTTTLSSAEGSGGRGGVVSPLHGFGEAASGSARVASGEGARVGSGDGERGGSGDGAKVALVRTQTVFNTAVCYKVKGCASPELGAHILLKLANKAGYEFGSSVVALTHLLHSDANSLYSSVIKEIPLTAGGQKRGHITAKFSLRFLASPLSQNGADNPIVGINV